MTLHLNQPGSGEFVPHQLLTLIEIADLLGRHLDTIKGWRAAGRWPHAVQDATGRKAWRVPVSDLTAAGDLHHSRLAEAESAIEASRESRKVQTLREENIRLHEQLRASESARAELAGMNATLTKLLLRRGDAA
ncbi:helix-turn-helix transcriptional regulator [Nocardioides kribbensis]|uniref:helix-turn-helix transcriptional regulator n=1 Tax=Nocardioides kribbensis TaxID=305517 RepID=UPI0032DAF81B